MKSFNPDEFENYASGMNGDISIVFPGKLYAFPGPTTSAYEIRFQRRFSPMHYVPLFKKLRVSCVVRLNEKCYPPTSFTQHGLHHIDLPFPDGSAPPFAVAKSFLDLAANEESLAIHCKAGLGRTGTLIALYLMFYLKWTAAEAMAWVRIVRPGSIMGVQHIFLVQMEDVISNKLREIPKELKFFASGPIIPNNRPYTKNSTLNGAEIFKIDDSEESDSKGEFSKFNLAEQRAHALRESLHLAKRSLSNGKSFSGLSSLSLSYSHFIRDNSPNSSCCSPMARSPTPGSLDVISSPINAFKSNAFPSLRNIRQSLQCNSNFLEISAKSYSPKSPSRPLSRTAGIVSKSLNFS